MNREPGSRSGGSVRAAIVLRRDLEVLPADVAVHVLVLNADVREVDVPVGVREAVLPRPLLDLLRGPVGTAVAVAVAAIPLLEEPLVLPFELAIQFDTQDARLARLEALCGLQVGAIDLRVVSALPRVIGAR